MARRQPSITSAVVGSIPLRREPTDLKRLLGTTLDVLARQARDLDVDLRVEADSDLPSIDVDPEKIAWAVVTLVGNALRYVRRGTRRMPGGSIVVELRADTARDAAVIVVKDDGPGIPADKLPFLFKRAAGAPHAAGLGLLLVADVVAAHAGTIEVVSDDKGLDRGTTVTIHLPLR